MTATSVDPLPAVAPAHPDWLFHHLRIEGPADAVAGFRAAASGAGIVLWHFDFERVEEDAFSPSCPGAGSIGIPLWQS